MKRGAFAVTALVALLVAAGAQAAPTWLAPLNLSAAGRAATSPYVAASPAGDVVAVWVSQSGPHQIVQASFRPAGGPWSMPQDLSLPPPPLSFATLVEGPQVAMDASGNAIAVWSRYAGDADSTYMIQAAVRAAASGVWTAAQTVSAGKQDARFPDLAVNAAGDVVVGWSRSDGSNVRIEAAYRPAASGVWGMPAWLSDPGQDANSADVAIDPAGTATAAWSRFDGSFNNVQASVRSAAAGAWAAPAPVSAVTAGGAGFGAFSPRIAVNASGAALVGWHQGGLGTFRLFTASRPAPSGAWSAPADIAPSEPGSYSRGGARFGIDTAGNATAVWPNISFRLQASVRPAGGAWQAPAPVSAPVAAGATDPALVVGAAGNAVVVWEQSDGTHERIRASRRPSPLGGWTEPETLSAVGQEALQPTPALDAAGNGVAIWRRSDGSNPIAQTAGLDAAGPLFRSLSVPTNGTARRAVAFSASPFDVWSTLGPGPVWAFGDGGNAAGTNVTHTYSGAGVYPVTVVQADTLGNESSASGSITIAAPACVVPKVIRKKLAQAKAAIRKAQCTVGKVRRLYSAKVKKGHVVSQKPKAGRRLARGARVALAVSRGPRPRRP